MKWIYYKYNQFRCWMTFIKIIKNDNNGHRYSNHYIKGNHYVFDLTDIFGYGNEPSPKKIDMIIKISKWW